MTLADPVRCVLSLPHLQRRKARWRRTGRRPGTHPHPESRFPKKRHRGSSSGSSRPGSGGAADSCAASGLDGQSRDSGLTNDSSSAHMFLLISWRVISPRTDYLHSKCSASAIGSLRPGGQGPAILGLPSQERPGPPPPDCKASRCPGGGWLGAGGGSDPPALTQWLG